MEIATAELPAQLAEADAGIGENLVIAIGIAADRERRTVIATFAGDDIDHAAQGIGTVQGGAGPLDDLHPLDGIHAQTPQIDAAIDASDHAAAIHQDQHVL